MKAADVLLFSQASGLAVEFEVQGRTFQISGMQGMRGYWERFYHKNSHPTRDPVSHGTMEEMLALATDFVVYRQYKDDGETVDRDGLAKKINDQFPRMV